jgi:hypothetical protein
MNYREFFKLSRLSYIMLFGIVDPQLWLKNRATVQNSVFVEMS